MRIRLLPIQSNQASKPDIILDARIEEITLINFDPIFYLKWPRKVCPKPFQIEDRFREQSP